ncbi:septation protein SepH [Tersicoccus mangrovi]|uniref:septation protein SepH n=1 Tax=Tersicoccus mangrovi TaxID=3121635 RepID=UPI003A7F3795
MGVHEDGDHLLFGDDAGAMYKVRIDETLRVATQRVPRRQARQTPAVKVPLSPREIQARIRAGASAEQIAVESGYDLDHIRRYEAPVRAERDWLAGQARQVEVASPSHHDEYRAAFGDQPATLDRMVAVRLRSLAVDPATVQWDAWRRQDGSWDVVARFDLPEESAIDLGEQPPAQWVFDPSRKHLANANRWAQVLSELEPLSGPIPPRRLAAVTDSVFDVESQPEVEDESADLLDVLRSRRGQRLGSDEEADDALALLLSRGPVPAAHPRPGQDALPGMDDDGEDATAGTPAGAEPAPDATTIDEDGQQVPDDGDASSASGSPAREGHRWGSGRSRLRGRNRRGDAPEDVSVDDLLGFDRGSVPGNEAGADATGGDAEPHADAHAEDTTAAASSGADASDGAPADVTTDDGTTESEGVRASGAQSPAPQSSGQQRPAGAPSAAARGTSPAEESDEAPKKGRPQDSDQGAKGKARRSSVPSWDEIVFGKRGD